MMKNRGALLALLVLGIATVLMVFFVLPRIGGNSEAPKVAIAPTVSEPAKQAEIKAPAAVPSKPDIAAIGTAANAKMARLKQTADNAFSSLGALFADGKVPSGSAFGDSRAVVQTAFEALAATELPDGIDSAIADGIRSARAGATKALALLKDLPTDPAQAVAHVANIGRALNGQDILAVATPAPVAPVPAESQPAAQPAQTTTAPAPAAAPVAASQSPEGLTPKFDVLRVEPDGSAVIAGNSLPGAKIEVVDGNNKVVAAAAAGPAGDFATVLDIPLPPGNHALALRATDGNGNSATSIEVATVAVPEKGNGQQLLAMITKPGEASRVITMPEASAADKQPRVVSEQPVAPPAPADVPAPVATIETPALPSGSATLSQTAPTIIASAPPEASKTAPATAPTMMAPVAGNLQVTAVEIEGDKIFIAGTATSGSTVRAYANDALVGETRTDASGHFVVEGRVPLAVGDHTIRAELVDAAGKVVMRTTVPFNRPPGEQVAAVASATPQDSVSAASLVPLDKGAFDQQRDALARAFAILQGLYADGKTPSLDQLAAARSATEIALKSIVDFRPATETSAAVVERIGRTSASAAEALAVLQPLPREVSAIGSALPKIAALVARVIEGAAEVTAQAPAAAPATAAQPAQTETAAATTIQQAPLTASANSVIIRQGDTLWQISRRVYGQGVRYTTIYLANEKAISNPDRIAPGQIFTLPDTALTNAEELHRRRLRGEKLD